VKAEYHAPAVASCATTVSGRLFKHDRHRRSHSEQFSLFSLLYTVFHKKRPPT